MNFELLLENLTAYSTQVLALVAAAWALAALFRLRLPRAVLGYWQGVLLLCLLLPWIQPRQRPVIADVSAPAAVRSRVVSAAPVESSEFPLYEAAAAILLAGIAVRLAWLGIGFCRLSVYRRRATRLDRLPPALEYARQATGASAAFYLSPEAAGPVSFGLFSPAVLLPARFGELGPAFQRAIACHELLHVRRRDWLLTLAEEMVRTLLWFHPAIWWLLGRIQLAREQAVDREVIEITAGRDNYVEALLEMANVRGRLACIPPAPLFLRRRHFARRLESIVKEVAMSKIRLAGSLAAMSVLLSAAGALTVWTLPLKGEPEFTPAQAQQEPERIRVSARVQERKLLYSPEPVAPSDIRGVVKLVVVISTDGTVNEVRAVSGHPRLVAAAVEAVGKWRYRPTLLDGEPVEVTTEIEVRLGPPQSGEQVFRVGGDVTRPRLLYKVEPKYTEVARDSKLEGTVVLSCEIGPDGVPRNIRVERWLGLGLDEKAVEAVEQWRFRPGEKGGQPVAVRATIEVNFRLL